MCHCASKSSAPNTIKMDFRDADVNLVPQTFLVFVLFRTVNGNLSIKCWGAYFGGLSHRALNLDSVFSMITSDGNGACTSERFYIV